MRKSVWCAERIQDRIRGRTQSKGETGFKGKAEAGVERGGQQFRYLGSGGRRPRAQGHSWLRSECEASPAYRKFCLEKAEIKNAKRRQMLHCLDFVT